jgi:hypothetical protein
MTAMTGEISTCIPAVEMRHYLDPLDTDDGPLQRLALRSPVLAGEPAPEAVPLPVSEAASDTPGAGYPLAV